MNTNNSKQVSRLTETVMYKKNKYGLGNPNSSYTPNQR